MDTYNSFILHTMDILSAMLIIRRRKEDSSISPIKSNVGDFTTVDRDSSKNKGLTDIASDTQRSWKTTEENGQVRRIYNDYMTGVVEEWIS